MKILLAEDEVDLNNVVTRYLKKNGYSVDSVLDGEEALDYLKYSEYDLVILDIMMPKVDGFEVIKKLRDKGNHTSVLMLTARDSADDKVKGLDLGADDYIVKPFDFNELMARIRAVVRRKYGNSSNKLVIGNLVLNIYLINFNFKNNLCNDFSSTSRIIIFRNIKFRLVNIIWKKYKHISLFHNYIKCFFSF